METTEYIKKLRRYLDDTDGKIWKDEELETFLEKALDDYSEDTGAFKSSFSIHTDEDGVCKLPSRYRRFLVGWNAESRRIENVSARELARFHTPILEGDGLPEFIYESFDSEGYVRFCPNPRKRQGDKTYYPHYPYGIPAIPAYGTPLRAIGYGIPLVIWKFKRVGDIYYIALGLLEKVFDYAAIIHNAAFQAYSADSDFADATKAQFHKALYDSRVSRFNQIARGKRIQRKSGNYF